MSNLGAVCNLEYAAPADDSPESAAAARLYDGIYNRFFLGGMFHGAYPDDVLEGLGPHMPEGWQDDFAVIRAPVDWCGINYYTRALVAPDDGPWPAHRTLEGPLPKTAMGWEIYPEGLQRLLERVHAEYTRGLPIYVTENGLASHDVLEGGTVEDRRGSTTSRHLGACARPSRTAPPSRAISHGR
jgi:beta-glucosidase